MSDEVLTTTWFIAYGIKYIPNDVIIYVGHTGRREGVRSGEHSNLASGARRVVTAYAQGWLTPNEKFFEYVVLWNGYCTLDQIKAIEQYFINLYDTRIFPRPTNGITKDNDLMKYGSHPSKLNINMACRDQTLIEWATSRVRHDLAIVAVPTELEKLDLDHELAVVNVYMKNAAKQTAVVVLTSLVGKYRNLESMNMVCVTDIHVDLNSVSVVAVEDDGPELKALLQNRLQLYNVDRWSVETTFRASTIASEFETILRSCTDYEDVSNGEMLPCAVHRNIVEQLTSWYEKSVADMMNSLKEHKEKKIILSVECAAKKRKIEEESDQASVLAQVEHDAKIVLAQVEHGAKIAKIKTASIQASEMSLAAHDAKKRKIEEDSDHESELAKIKVIGICDAERDKQLKALIKLHETDNNQEIRQQLNDLVKQLWENTKEHLLGTTPTTPTT